MRNPLYESYPSHQSLRKKGLMLKKGRVRRNWKTREFEFDVTKGELSYLKEKSVRGCVKLHHLSEVKVPSAAKYEFQLEITMVTNQNGALLGKPFCIRLVNQVRCASAFVRHKGNHVSW